MVKVKLNEIKCIHCKKIYDLRLTSVGKIGKAIKCPHCNKVVGKIN
jgi:predicted Zn finger-like uncharacterized protein